MEKKEMEMQENIQTRDVKSRKRKNLEFISTILLSAATILSAWCVYQSSQWNGEQYFRIEDENNADRKRMQLEINSQQRQAGEALFFLQYVSAALRGDTQLEEFLHDRFPPHLEKAALAWRKLDPMNNPDAPISPMQMKEYVMPEEAGISKFAEEANKFKMAANKCDNHSDNYMLLSLILSTVLFFCGLSGVLNSNSNRSILLGFAGVIFIVALFFVILSPVII